MTLSKDPSSFSNPFDALVTHTDFEIDVDFEREILDCYCKHRLLIRKEGCDSLLLDSQALAVKKVLVQGQEAEHSITQSTDALGQAISVPLPKSCKEGDTIDVEFWWSTAKGAVAAQWLPAESTAGKKHPFLFTQCQAIHARSLYPCQDTPGAKFTYTAVVRTPKELVALMSSLKRQVGDASENSLRLLSETDTTTLHSFDQPKPISPYLFALAVGNLDKRDLSPISAVWAEPEMVDDAKAEFEDIPKFIAAAEELAGPYVWGRYDCLVLPPSFPYGGMENPCMTFVTPTLLAGDKSLVNVVAHEIGHSWTGNLVTNAQWNGFWLNEGPTVYLERRIIGLLEGEKMFQFMAVLGWSTLRATVDTWGRDHPFTKLVPDLSNGVDPDDAFSKIPYEKGFALLYHIESVVGKDNFIPFFKSYIQKFAQQPLGPDDFKEYCVQYFSGKGINSPSTIDWEEWFYGTGMPPVTNNYDTSLANEAFSLAESWARFSSATTQNATEPDFPSMQKWSTLQIVAFLDKLLELCEDKPLTLETIHAIECANELLKTTKNSEINCAWYMIKLKSGDESVIPPLKDFLKSQGRMKYLKPLYRALYESSIPNAKELATKIFNENKPQYHPIAVKMVGLE